MMKKFIESLEIIEDKRQSSKVRHKIQDVIVVVLMGTLANANTWEEIEIFAETHEEFLKQYIPLENGIPSHDTMQRVMGMIEPEYLEKIQNQWHEMCETDEMQKIQKVICIDGKTMRGNAGKNRKANHIVTAWCDESGYSLGEKKVDEKSNEIKAIPDLLGTIKIKGNVITIDAMGTQTDIAEKIKNKGADYVLPVKENQKNLYKEVKDYLDDEEFQNQIKEKENYKRTIEKKHGQTEIREYYQTDKIKWLENKDKWNGIKTIGSVVKTIKRGKETITETRYYISSLKPNIELFAKAVRQHWSVEVMHWHLDVTFKEDANKTLDKIAAQNMNILRKWALSILKTVDFVNKKQSLSLKRYMINTNPQKYLAIILEM